MSKGCGYQYIQCNGSGGSRRFQPAKLSTNFCFLFFAFCSFSQSVCFASPLSSLIQIALETNPDLKSEHLSLSKEEISFNRAKKQELYPEIGMSSIVGGKSKKTEWIKDDEGERKQITNTKEKPSVELDTSISRPHPFGGKINLNLKMTEGLSTSNQDTWEASLNSEEPLSKSARQLLKTPFFDEQLQLDTAGLNLAEKINDIISEVINSYAQLQRSDATLNIRQKELEDLQSNIEISRLKLEKGLIPEMDIFQMELQASSVLSEMETIKKDKRGQMARFCSQVLGTQTTVEDVLTEVGPQGFLDRIKVLKGFIETQNHKGTEKKPPLPLLGKEGNYNPLTPAKGVTDGITDALLQKEGAASCQWGTWELGRIPQVKIKYIQLELSKRRLKEAEAKNAPVIIPAFTVNNSENTRNEEFRASVKFTIYDKGIKKEEIKLAQASLSQAEIELNNLLINTRIDITTTLDEIKDMERRIGVSNKDIGLAEKIYEIAKIKHQRGLISAKDLLEYQTDVFRKQKSIQDEQTDLFLEYVKLLKITGELYHAYKENIF